jgi:hypothetical protein
MKTAAFPAILFSVASAFGSSLAGAGSSTVACVGGLPYPCARTDVSVQTFSPLAVPYGLTGNIGQAVVDPDFAGTEFFRVTDGATESLGLGCCITRNSGELETFSLVEPALQTNGGYNIFVEDVGAQLLFGFDQKSFAVCQYQHGAGGCATASGGNPNGLNSANRVVSWTPWAFSQIQPTVLYGALGTPPTSLVKYDLYQDTFYNTSGSPSSTPVAFIDFSTCPGLPTPILPNNGSAQGASYGARGDRYFSAILGGIGQQYYLAVWEDVMSGNCYWQDTLHGLYGGTGFVGSQPTTVGMLRITAAPSLSASAGGTVNVCAKVTANTSIVVPGATSTTAGESLPSAEVTTTASAGATMTLTFGSYANPYFLGVPGCANSFLDTAPCEPYNVYMSENASGSCTGTEELQNGATTVSGPTYTIAVSSIVTGTATPPVSTSAGFNIHQGNPNQSGSTMILANTDNNSQLFLSLPNSGVPCQGGSAIVANSACAGHAVPGVADWVNNNGYIGAASNQYALSIRPLSSPASPSALFTCSQAPGNCTYDSSIDMHLSWNVASDAQPVEEVNYFSNAAVTGNGSTNLNSNPCWNVQSQGGVNEILLAATDLSGKVYRIGHHRNGACYTPWTNAADLLIGGNLPIGQVSQDGKFVVVHSQMGGTLGTSPWVCSNPTSYPTSGWQSSHTYSVGNCVWDGSNYEVVTSISGGASCFVSNSGAAPTWPLTSGITVTDGGAVNCDSVTTPTGTWTMNVNCNDANSYAAGKGGEACRSDIFVFKVK